MRCRFKIICVVFFVFGNSTYTQDFSASRLESIPLNHWAYDAIEYLHLKGFFQDLNWNIRPFKKGEVINEILTLQAKKDEFPLRFNKYETFLITRLVEEFRQEFDEMSDSPAGNTTRGYYFINPLLNYSTPVDSSEAVRSLLDLSLALNFGSFINVKTRFELDTDGHKDLDYRGFRQWKSLSADMSLASLTVGLPNCFVQIGRDYQAWGPGRFGSLILSDNMPTLDMVNLQFKVWKFKFSSFTAILNRMMVEDSLWANRYLSGSRLNFKPNDNLEFGLSQTILYGGVKEPIHPFYSNPFVVYYLADYMLSKENGTTDNNMVSFDCSWEWNNALLYGEFLIDDAIYDGSDNPNKIGYTIGATITDPFHVDGLLVRAEYTRVTRWVYSHFEKTPYKKYQFYKGIIGHWIGPDSDLLNCCLRYYVSNGLVLNADYSYLRHGENNIDSPWYGPDGMSYLKRSNPFPTGIVERGQVFNFFINYRPNINMEMDLKYCVKYAENYKNIRNNTNNKQIVSISFSYRFRKLFAFITKSNQ